MDEEDVFLSEGLLAHFALERSVGVHVLFHRITQLLSLAVEKGFVVGS